MGVYLMDDIQERLSYLHGLAEGLELYQNKKEGKFFQELMVLITEMNDELSHSKARLSELEEYVEAIDEDLNDIEIDYYGDPLYDDEFDEYDDYDDELLTNEDLIDEEDDIELEDDEIFEQVECPSCHEIVLVNTDLDEDEIGEVVCPHCHELFIVDNEDDMEYQPQ